MVKYHQVCQHSSSCVRAQRGGGQVSVRGLSVISLLVYLVCVHTEGRGQLVGAASLLLP